MVQSTEQTPPAAETDKDEEPDTQVLVYRIPLDPNPSQHAVLIRYARAYRSTYNYGNRLAAQSHEQWAAGRDKLVEEGLSKAEANKKAPKVKHPSAYSMAATFRANREKEFGSGDITYAWWHGVNENMCCNAFTDVQRAWTGWRAGRTGFPKFKRHGGGRQSFRFQKGKFDDVRHLRVPGGGGQKALSIRTSRPASRILRQVNKGGNIGAVTVSQVGDRWFASINVRVIAHPKRKHTRTQRENGAVGVDLGISVIAATSQSITLQDPTSQAYGRTHDIANARRNLAKWKKHADKRRVQGYSDSEQPHGWHEAIRKIEHYGARIRELTTEPDSTVRHGTATREPTTQTYENPQHLAKASRNLAKWQRRAAKRYQRGKKFHEQSHGWHEAIRHVRRLHALVAERRATTQHTLTKALTTQFRTVAIEDIQVQKMTQSPKGTRSQPGKGVRHKAKLNRAVLDVGFGEIRRQLAYKSQRYGSDVIAVDPAYTSQTCSRCGHVDKRSRKSAKEFICTRCSHAVHAKIGAAQEIERRGTNPEKP